MKRRLVWGEVAGVGAHVRSVSMGDRVLFRPDGQLEADVAGEIYFVLRQRDLPAVSNEDSSEGTGLHLRETARRGPR